MLAAKYGCAQVSTEPLWSTASNTALALERVYACSVGGWACPEPGLVVGGCGGGLMGQVLWLGENHTVTEVGAMNLLFFWVNEQGEQELVTAPLSRGDILPGACWS